MTRAPRQSENALTHGILGRGRAALAPSLRAVGPNTYLGSRVLFTMMGIAFLVHATAFGIMALWPEESVKDIPVQALRFKLGDDSERVAPIAPVHAVEAAPEVVSPPVMQATNDESWEPEPARAAPIVPAPLQPAPLPKQRPKPEKPKPRAARENAATPHQYVREVGAAPLAPAPMSPSAASGTVSGEDAARVKAKAEQAIRARYEQQISGWVQRHKLYPDAANGAEGRAVVRVRIDRLGNVRYYAIEQSTGNATLDAGALDMIRRANPMPAVPVDYPEGNLVEFLIPISFKVPI